MGTAFYHKNRPVWAQRAGAKTYLKDGAYPLPPRPIQGSLPVMRVRSIAPWALLFFTLTACSGEITGETTSSSSGSSGSSSSGSSSSSSGNPGEWTRLVDGTWELPSGIEGYWCSTKTFQQDTYIKAFRAVAPAGTHHTLLLRTNGGQPDGEGPCGPTLGADMLFASGVGTDDLTFPPGVAVLIPAGTQLTLNLHLFNTTSQTISGVSGTDVQLAAASEVTDVAELVLGGTGNIAIPPNGTQTVEGVCSFPTAATVITVWPHMHQYGTHMKVSYEGSAGNQVLHDLPYSFSNQKNYPITPLKVAPGDLVRIACSYQNTTSNTIYFGDSSTAEMCFGGLYLYPKLEPGIMCQ